MKNVISETVERLDLHEEALVKWYDLTDEDEAIDYESDYESEDEKDALY